MDNFRVVKCECNNSNLNWSVSFFFSFTINVEAREIGVSRFHFIFDIGSKLANLRYRISLIEVLFLEVLIHLWINFELKRVISSRCRLYIIFDVSILLNTLNILDTVVDKQVDPDAEASYGKTVDFSNSQLLGWNDAW